MHDTWKSKKLWFSVGVIGVAFVFAVLAATLMPKLEPMYSAFLGILEFTAGAYLTGNVANKLVIAKANPGTVVESKPAPKAPAKPVPPGGPKVPDED